MVAQCEFKVLYLESVSALCIVAALQLLPTTRKSIAYAASASNAFAARFAADQADSTPPDLPAMWSTDLLATWSNFLMSSSSAQLASKTESCQSMGIACSPCRKRQLLVPCCPPWRQQSSSEGPICLGHVSYLVVCLQALGSFSMGQPCN